jgi:hypothetical protein
MPGSLRVGPRQQQAPIGPLRLGGPGLLPADHPLVTVADRLRPQAGEIGTGLGLAESLTPPLLTGEHLRNPFAALLIVAESQDHVAQVDRVRYRRCPRGRDLLTEDAVEDRRQAVTSVLAGQRDPGPAAGVEFPGPFGDEPGAIIVVLGIRIGGHVRLQPDPEARPEVRLLLRVVEVDHAVAPRRASAISASWACSSPRVTLSK